MVDLIAAGTTAPRVDVRAWPGSAGDVRYVFGAMRACIGVPDGCVEHAVKVVDSDGRPAAFAQVVVLEHHQGWQGVRDRCVADAEGVVHLVTDGAKLRLIATDERQLGCVALQPEGGAVELRMAPMAFAELRVRDAAGQPARSVRTRMQLNWSGGDIVGYFLNQSLLTTVRADHDGVLRLPVLDEQLGVIVELPEGVEVERTLTPGERVEVILEAHAGGATQQGIR